MEFNDNEEYLIKCCYCSKIIDDELFLFYIADNFLYSCAECASIINERYDKGEDNE